MQSVRGSAGSSSQHDARASVGGSDESRVIRDRRRMQPGLLLAHQMEAVQREQNLRLFKQTVVLK